MISRAVGDAFRCDGCLRPEAQRLTPTEGIFVAPISELHPPRERNSSWFGFERALRIAKETMYFYGVDMQSQGFEPAQSTRERRNVTPYIKIGCVVAYATRQSTKLRNKFLFLEMIDTRQPISPASFRVG
jgi:hypothetical protein